MCEELKKNGIMGFHFYTLNLEKSVRLILEGLQFVAPIEVAKPLPWQPVRRILSMLFVFKIISFFLFLYNFCSLFAFLFPISV
jgi:hypothetical protein